MIIIIDVITHQRKQYLKVIRQYRKRYNENKNKRQILQYGKNSTI